MGRRGTLGGGVGRVTLGGGGGHTPMLASQLVWRPL